MRQIRSLLIGFPKESIVSCKLETLETIGEISKQFFDKRCFSAANDARQNHALWLISRKQGQDFTLNLSCYIGTRGLLRQPLCSPRFHGCPSANASLELILLAVPQDHWRAGINQAYQNLI